MYLASPLQENIVAELYLSASSNRIAICLCENKLNRIPLEYRAEKSRKHCELRSFFLFTSPAINAWGFQFRMLRG